MRGIALLLVLISSPAFAQITNYRLAEHDVATAAPGAAIAVSPRNNKNMVAYAAGKLLYSNDAGVTWKDSAPGMTETANGTPSLAVDPKGTFYLVYSSASLAQIVTISSGDDGKTWSKPTIISEAAGSDKFNPHIIAHHKKEDVIVTWTQLGKYGDRADSCKSNVMMSASGGKKWSAPIQINQKSGNCLDADYTLRGSMPCIAFDSKIFVLWASQGAMFYDRSYDGGDMWISTDLAIAPQVGGWTLDVPGFGLVANTAVLTTDNSASRIRGTMFLVYSDMKSGDDDSDIWLMRSVNRGDNWTVAARINQDEPGKHQFVPRITIDPANGVVYILYYDRRNYSDNQTDVYLAWSSDGGNQFKEVKVNEKPFTPNLASMGITTDYLNISAQKGLIVPVWTAINGSKQEVWTAVIKEYDLNK